MLLPKLCLVALSVLLSTLAARRFGHAVGGAVAGMPMIAAPIMAILLIDHDAASVREIALATLACLPAAILHIVTFAKAAPRFRWPVCLAMAMAVFLASGLVLARTPLPPVATCVLAVAAPMAGLWYAAHHSGPPARVGVPRSEFVLRIGAAVAMAAAIILGADAFPASVSGLLLAVPITGTVLPCFTLPRYGAAATASLMTGFLRGLHGFAAFFVVLYVALGHMHPAVAFVAALAAALVVAVGMQVAVRRASDRLPREGGKAERPERLGFPPSRE